MQAWTPSERRGALVFVLLLALGAGWDLWCARRATRPAPAPAADVPVAADTAAPAGDREPAPPGLVTSPGAASVIDLNRASAAELDALPGVGPVLAHRILEFRALHGRFESPEDLLAVRGIGPRLFERLRPRVRAGR